MCYNKEVYLIEVVSDILFVRVIEYYDWILMGNKYIESIISI